MFQMDYSKYRPGQLGAHATITRLATDKIVSIVNPTRYGKSDIIRCSFLDLHYQGIASCAVVLSPATHLEKQMVDKDKVEAMFGRYSISIPDTLKSFRPIAGGNSAFREWRNWVKTDIENSPVIISTTVQYAVYHGLNVSPWLSDWIDYVIHVTGLPPVFYIDECHIGSYANRIGELIQYLKHSGALVVVLTATPYRMDGEKIPGFDYELVDEESVRRYIVSEYSEDQSLIQVMQSLVGTYRMIADYQYSFADAWAETPCPLSDIDIVTIDCDVTRYMGGRVVGDSGEVISQLSPNTTRTILGEVTRDNEVIAKGIDSLLHIMSLLRSSGIDASAAGIVFVGSDTDEEDNKEANRVKALIAKRDPAMRVVIATSATSDKAEDTIKAFVNGDGDILIVKMMASLGLDCDRLKVGLDLSPIRSQASYIQRLMRIATVHPIYRHAYWITPADKLSVGMFQWIVAKQDGTVKIPINSELIDEYLKPIGPSKPECAAVVTNPQLGEVFNNNDVVGPRDFHFLYEKFVSKVPQVASVVSRADLMNAFANTIGVVTPPKQEANYSDGTVEIEQAKSNLVAAHRTLAGTYLHARIKPTKDECYQHAWQEMRTALYLPWDWSYKAETSVDLLKKGTLWLKTRNAQYKSAA